MKYYIIPNSEKGEIISFLTALCFAVLPFNSNYGLSIAGQPILIYLFLNLINYRKNLFLNIILICLFPIFSIFSYSGMFLIIILISLSFFIKINKEYIFALFLLIIVYIATEWTLFYNYFFNPLFISHRQFYLFSFQSLKFVFKDFLNTLAFGISNVPTFAIFTLFILFYIILSHKKLPKIYWILTGLLIIIPVFSSLYNNLSLVLFNYLPILTRFQFARFTWLLPTIIYILFGLTLNCIYKKYSINKVYFIFFIQLLIILLFSFISLNTQLSIDDYYQPELFNQIKEAIPINNSYVLSLGLQPAILQENGFYTIGFYNLNYPIETKLRFRAIIEKELDKSDYLKDYFDNWGNRAYLFSSELFIDNQYLSPVKSKLNISIKNLEINTEAIKEIDGKYIFSTVQIENYKEINLDFIHKFNNKGVYDIYVYVI